MTALKVLVVDDEVSPRGTLKDYIERFDNCIQVEEASDGFEAIELVQSFDPDIVFLDITMPGLSGFDVLCHFPTRAFKVVFQTAHDEFALQAFEESAVDYLLKPFSYDRFAKSMKKITEAKLAQVNEVREKLVSKGMRLNSIRVSLGNRSKAISTNNIIYFYTESREVKLITSDNDYYCDLRLNELEKQLEGRFLRVHRGFLINLAKVDHPRFARGSTKVIMENGDAISVSREMRKTLKEEFRNR